MEIVALLALTQKLQTCSDGSGISVFTGESGCLAKSGKGTPARMGFGSHADFTSAHDTNLYRSVKQRFDCRKGQKEKKWLFWERDEPGVSVESGSRLVFGIND